MLSRLLGQILLALIHFIVSGVIAVQNVYYRILARKSNLRGREVTKSEIKMIIEQMPKNTKPLKHLVVLTDVEHHTLTDLARLVIWSLVAGVPFVSFYDTSGNLVEKEEKLFYEVEKFKKGIPGCVKWSKMPDLNGYTNGFVAHTVVVNIITNDDGRRRIAECVKKIAEGKIVCKRNSKEFTAQEFGEAVTQVYPACPDPDIIFYTGPSCCTRGVLPWQIRLTEFIQISLNHNININNYLNAIIKYNKCDQRFGK